jgi:hypothetical protein
MLITAFLWVFQKISPILTVIGALVLFGDGYKGYEFIVGAVLAVFGLIVGWSTWGQEVPPRWFWVKSKLELFDNRVGNAFSYALQFFLIPFAITGIIAIVDRL